MQKIQNKFKKSLRHSTTQKLFSNSVLMIILVSILTSALLLNCSSVPNNNKTDITHFESAAKPQKNDEFSILSINVENLFDTEHDSGTDDYTYLPLSEKSKPEIKNACDKIKNSYYKKECLETDWNSEILSKKLAQIEKSFRYINNGLGPDVSILIEVENLKVLNKLTQTNLKDLNYQTRVLIEGPDTRGIDPAIISKFPLKSSKLHIIPYQDKDPEDLKRAQKSRGILEAVLILPNKKEITILAAHFPSQSSPTEWRKQAHEFLKNKMLEYEKQGRAVIAGGDLNTIDLEERDYGYFSKILSQAGDVSHLVGCKHCEGSHNYRGEWSFLDVLIFGKGLLQNKLSLLPESVTTVKAPHALKKNGTPLRFNDQTGEGVSDHLPLFAKIKFQ